MGKFASKDMALRGKTELEAKVGKASWFKRIELDADDHGYYLNLKITSMNDVCSANDTIPSTITVDGFNLKICIFSLGK